MFYSLPIEKRLDFHCVPPDLLTYAELEAISRQLANEITSGQVRKYQWDKFLGRLASEYDRPGGQCADSR